MKKSFILILVVLGLTVSGNLYSQGQVGGRKSEKKERRGKRRGEFILTQYKSRGHADDFARSKSGRMSKFKKLFKGKKNTPWVYKSSGSKRSHWKENRFLFTRHRAPGHKENADIQEKQNRERASKREHGNRTFRFRKYR